MSKEDHSQDGLGQQRRDIQGQLHSQLFDDAYDIADCGVLSRPRCLCMIPWIIFLQENIENPFILSLLDLFHPSLDRDDDAASNKLSTCVCDARTYRLLHLSFSVHKRGRAKVALIASKK